MKRKTTALNKAPAMIIELIDNFMSAKPRSAISNFVRHDRNHPMTG
jgi:hypothetical protein